jgi:polar amino acid transport system substrate-binding protein
VVTVGTEGTWPPYEYYDEAGNLTGFDIELMRAIGGMLGKEIKVVDMPFDGLIPALLTGKIDAIAACMNATAERKRTIDFSDVYIYSDATLITKADNKTLNRALDMNGRTIAVQLGTTQDIFVSDMPNVTIEIKRFRKTGDAVREVLLDRVDGFLVSTEVAKSFVASSQYQGDLKLAFRVSAEKPEEGFAIGVKKGDPEFLNAINGAMRELKASGALGELREKYEAN